ncbi:HTH-type transcriptional repressor YtrA [Andreprevotia sp. IGB-42]|uniref:GntR family transcriptional regulator n=1 Tax=Andreprevotia sp. IGB-42 TaxID=2497473 RepID=UPI00135A2F3F|nr:GntR family transcriptional regulator [Andreprevotia sp. IGB-42]KAF0813429.1 HTH-type transcriptional repressor YtrA [Andreprevotia sp. IGB-42]
MSLLHALSVSPGSGEPIYRQLMDQIRRLAAGGQLQPGSEMPSVRELAQALAVNPMTVSKVYSLLELEGVLLRRRGLGMQVADQGAATHGQDERLALLRGTLQRAALEAKQLELEPAAVLALLQQLLEEKP